MGITYSTLWTTTFYILKAHGDYAFQLWSSNILFFASLALCITIWKVEPGYLERKPGFEFVEILE
jgi:hypothetical protein